MAEKNDEVETGSNVVTEEAQAIAELTAKFKEMDKELKKAKSEAAKASKAAEEAKAEAAALKAAADEAKLNMGGNNLKKMNAWRMPPTASHVVAGTKSAMPSGNTIVNA